MFNNYNLMYYYKLLFKFEKGINEIISLIEDNNLKFKSILFQIMIISGVITTSSTIMNKSILPNIIGKEEISTILYITVFVFGALASLGTIFAFFIFLYVISNFQVQEKESLKKKLFSISVTAYLPVLAGSIVNLVLNFFLGVKEFGYTTAYGIFRPENNILVSLSQEIDPFKFVGVLVASYLYCKLFKRNTKSFTFLVITWYVVSLLFILISGM